MFCKHFEERNTFKIENCFCKRHNLIKSVLTREKLVIYMRHLCSNKYEVTERYQTCKIRKKSGPTVQIWERASALLLSIYN